MSDNDDTELLKAHGHLLQQLLQSKRFAEFFKLNYDLHKIIDDENKEVVFTIIEVPVEVVQQRIAAKVQEVNQGVQIAPASAMPTSNPTKPLRPPRHPRWPSR